MSVYSSFHKTIFSLISSIYSLFFQINSRKDLKKIEAYREILGKPEEVKVLDLGCGTGTLTWAFREAGFKVVGADISPAMMRTARKNGIDCVETDILAGTPFKDESFELVCASFVAHGMRKNLRRKLYAEASRLSSERVLFQDYNDKLPFFPVIIIELLELLIGGDFFGFRKTAIDGMLEYFSEVIEYQVDRSCSWYICRK
ncbi:MAG: class I SAM-dependent methyltransferase [Spirochaetales bacterium]|uniref:Class I SAM-dependent methyltransferase n=1 Tax=Candidatus Thalassospirochaeta sargassi TaxID=3119039 RepID=A0AAJ1IG12_9SPIO|nr:class I SAM-dependent methyltransferase [Spirochaetales bacterium]